MRKLRTLAPSQLERLIKEGKPVYVMNTSSLPSGDKGMVIVNFYDGTRREFFKMPPTFIPMAVTDSIPPQNLMNSKDFRQCLIKGMLTLIEPQSAEAYLATPEAQDEYDSLVLSEISAKAQKVDINKTVSQRTRVAHTNNQSHGPIQDVSAVDTVSNKVRGLVESMLAGSLTDRESLIQLRRHQSALTSVDFSYVLANTTNVELRKWAKTGLSRSSEEEYDDIDNEVEGEEEDVVEQSTKIKKNRQKKSNPARSAGTAGTAGTAEPKGSQVNKKEDYANIFDFEKDENLVEDARHRNTAIAQQALGSQSMYQEEINKILNGQ